MYKANLEEEVASETLGDVKRLLISTLQFNRGENTNLDIDALNKDLQDLYEAGESQWGTDEFTFNKVFSIRSQAELKYLDNKYAEVARKSLFSVIDSEFSEDLTSLIKVILLAQANPSEFFATRIRKACIGVGIIDNLLIRVLITRDEVD